MAEFAELSLEKMFGPLLQKSDIEKEYDSAKSVDNLFISFSHAVAFSAASIMFSLKGPKRSGFLLRILKTANQDAYDAYWNRFNHLLSQCLMVVVAQLHPFLIKELKSEDVEYISDMTVVWGGIALSNISRLSADEEKAFKKTLHEILLKHIRNPFKDFQDQLKRILDAHGKKPTPEEIAKLVLAIQRSSDYLHPWAFIQNWKRLSKK